MGYKIFDLFIETAVDEAVVDKVQWDIYGYSKYSSENSAENTKRDDDTRVKAMSKFHRGLPIYNQHREWYGLDGF